MRKDQRRNLPSAVAVVILAGLSLACGLLWNSPAPERSVEIIDLLIELDDMPQGWRLRRGPDEAMEDFNVNEGLEIVFEADSPYTNTVAAHTVLRYRDLEEAAWVYKDRLTPSEFGKASVPDGWVYRSVMADPYYVFCFRYSSEPQYLCEWSGLYAEYIVVFHTWLIPDRMTLEDFESIVKVIDWRTACSLGGSCMDSSRRSR